VKLDPGDQILLFTDGVTEAMNPRHELFGNERLLQEIVAADGGIDRLVHQIVGSVESFREGRSASDDMTLVGFERYLA
jgi:sigma-B regulation protein RsbU (phosphoserine phosphatase)